MKSFILIILAFICSPFIIWGGYEIFTVVRKYNQYVHTRGIVVDNSIVHAADGNAYLPHVRFAVGKKSVGFIDKVGSMPADYEEGDSVKVIYNPLDYTNAEIYSFKRFWLIPFLMTLIGILPICIFLIIARKMP